MKGGKRSCRGCVNISRERTSRCRMREIPRSCSQGPCPRTTRYQHGLDASAASERPPSAPRAPARARCERSERAPPLLRHAHQHGLDASAASERPPLCAARTSTGSMRAQRASAPPTAPRASAGPMRASASQRPPRPSRASQRPPWASKARH